MSPRLPYPHGERSHPGGRGGDPGAHAHAYPDANAHARAHAYPDTNAHPHAGTDPDAHSYAYPRTYAGAYS